MGEAIYTRPSGVIPGKSDAKGAILRKPLHCLDKDSIGFLVRWLESVIFKILPPDKFDTLSLSDAEKILSSLVQDICQKLEVNHYALRLSPLADSGNSPASSAKPFLGLMPAAIGETLSHFYAALVNRRCNDTSLKILIQGGHAGPQGLAVRKPNQCQFRALAVRVYWRLSATLETIFRARNYSSGLNLLRNLASFVKFGFDSWYGQLC
jgi:hypothetical protein